MSEQPQVAEIGAFSQTPSLEAEDCLGMVELIPGYTTPFDSQRAWNVTPETTQSSFQETELLGLSENAPFPESEIFEYDLLNPTCDPHMSFRNRHRLLHKAYNSHPDPTLITAEEMGDIACKVGLLMEEVLSWFKDEKCRRSELFANHTLQVQQSVCQFPSSPESLKDSGEDSFTSSSYNTTTPGTSSKPQDVSPNSVDQQTPIPPKAKRGRPVKTYMKTESDLPSPDAKRKKVSVKYPCPDCENFVPVERWTEHINRKHFPKHVWECPKINRQTKVPCSSSPNYRPAYRDDNFSTHLKGEHNCSDAEVAQLKKTCKFEVVNFFHNVCGFCGESLKSRDESIEHIKSHFKKASEQSNPPTDLGVSLWKDKCGVEHTLQLGIHYRRKERSKPDSTAEMNSYDYDDSTNGGSGEGGLGNSSHDNSNFQTSNNGDNANSNGASDGSTSNNDIPGRHSKVNSRSIGNVHQNQLPMDKPEITLETAPQSSILHDALSDSDNSNLPTTRAPDPYVFNAEETRSEAYSNDEISGVPSLISDRSESTTENTEIYHILDPEHAPISKECAVVPRPCYQCRSKQRKCDGLSPCNRCTANKYQCRYDRARRGFRVPRKRTVCELCKQNFMKEDALKKHMKEGCSTHRGVLASLNGISISGSSHHVAAYHKYSDSALSEAHLETPGFSHDAKRAESPKFTMGAKFPVFQSPPSAPESQAPANQKVSSVMGSPITVHQDTPQSLALNPAIVSFDDVKTYGSFRDIGFVDPCLNQEYHPMSTSNSSLTSIPPSLISDSSSSTNFIFSSRDDSEKGRCTQPDCGKIFKDLKAHMLTHQNERPEKCPIQTCAYHAKGFARRYDKNRHTLSHYKGTMVCGFCPGGDFASEKSFNRADVFKRHLTQVHGVEQTPPNSRKKTSRDFASSRKLEGYTPKGTGRCSTCSQIFDNPQIFYEHLDDCVLRVLQQEDPAEAVNAMQSVEFEEDHVANPALCDSALSGNAIFTLMDVNKSGDSSTPLSHQISPNSPQTSRELTRSKGGVTLHTKGRKKRKEYPSSWGCAPQMKLKKRVLCGFDGRRPLWKDDAFLHDDFEIRVKASAVADLYNSTIQRADAFHNSTREEEGPLIVDDELPGTEVEKLIEVKG